MTLFTKSLAGSISGTGAPVKAPAKKVAGSVVVSGAFSSRPMTMVGVIAPVGALTLRTNKGFAGRSRMTGFESPVVAGGGTQLVESGGNTLAVFGFTRGPT